MNQNFDQVVQIFEAREKGFDAIENGLRNTIIDGLVHVVAPEHSWEHTRKALGIYTVNGRVKSKARLRRKLEALARPDGEITQDNFTELIGDLVGARVVCLHPDDLFDVACKIRTLLTEPDFFESPPAESGLRQCRVRHGIFSLLPIERFRTEGFDIDELHAVGYTSIHFVSRLGPRFSDRIDRAYRDPYRELCQGFNSKRCFVEVQLRTILEEAWGEVDHSTRYEDEELSNDPDLRAQFTAFAAYIQAGNHHISIIRKVARRKVDERGAQRIEGMTAADPGRAQESKE